MDYYQVRVLYLSGRLTLSKRMTFDQAKKLRDKYLKNRRVGNVRIITLYGQRWMDRRQAHQKGLSK